MDDLPVQRSDARILLRAREATAFPRGGLGQVGFEATRTGNTIRYPLVIKRGLLEHEQFADEIS